MLLGIQLLAVFKILPHALIKVHCKTPFGFSGSRTRPINKYFLPVALPPTSHLMGGRWSYNTDRVIRSCTWQGREFGRISASFMWNFFGSDRFLISEQNGREYKKLRLPFWNTLPFFPFPASYTVNVRYTTSYGKDEGLSLLWLVFVLCSGNSFEYILVNFI